MINIKKLEEKQKEMLNNLSEEELKQYIKILAKNYYIYFLNNEVGAFKNTVKQLEEVISVFKLKYSHINSYINLCLLESINKILNEKITSEIEVDVLDKTEDYFSTNPFKSLTEAFEESRQLYFNDVEMEKKIKELERKLAKYERS